MLWSEGRQQTNPHWVKLSDTPDQGNGSINPDHKFADSLPVQHGHHRFTGFCQGISPASGGMNLAMLNPIDKLTDYFDGLVGMFCHVGTPIHTSNRTALEQW